MKMLGWWLIGSNPNEGSNARLNDRQRLLNQRTIDNRLLEPY